MSKVSIYEVAERAGVSKSTVSRVLNDSPGISAGAKQKVLRAVEELKYRPNTSARDLRRKTNNLVGILISKEEAHTSIVHLVNSRKISGIVQKANDLGYDVIVFIEDISDSMRLKDIIREKGLNGIILLDRVPAKVLERFSSYDIPFVLVNWFISNYEHQIYVKTDLAQALVLALDVLTEKGYDDIGVINWEDSEMMYPVIEDTFIEYMQKKGLKYQDCVWNTSFHPPMEETIQYIKQSSKRAYISFSYLGSIDIIHYCREQNIRIPEDIALISYEFFDFFDYLHPQLTGIQQQAELMGEKAAEKLIKIIQGNKDVKSEMVSAKIILRNSC